MSSNLLFRFRSVTQGLNEELMKNVSFVSVSL